MSATSPKAETYLEGLPVWARELSEKYYSRSFALFLLSGNVRDLAPMRRNEHTEFVSVEEFLSNALFGQRDLILHYDRGGLSFGSAESQADFRRALEERRHREQILHHLAAERVPGLRPVQGDMEARAVAAQQQGVADRQRGHGRSATALVTTGISRSPPASCRGAFPSACR